MEHLDFQNKLVIIYGATGGLGSALATEFLKRGAKLGLIGRNNSKLKMLAHKLSLSESSLFSVASLKGKQDLLQAWLGSLGKIDYAIHASGLGKFQSARKLSEEDFEQMIQENLLTAFSFYKQIYQAIKADQWSLAFIGSASLDQVWPKNTAYGASKAGLAYFTKSLDLEIGQEGGRAFLFELGSVNTPFFDQASHHLPRNKMIQPEQAAHFIANHLLLPKGLISSPIRLLSQV